MMPEGAKTVDPKGKIVTREFFQLFPIRARGTPCAFQGMALHRAAEGGDVPGP